MQAFGQYLLFMIKVFQYWHPLGLCLSSRERERERIYYIIARVSESPLLDGATERVLMIVPFNRTMTTTTTSMAIAQKEGGGGDGSVLM